MLKQQKTKIKVEKLKTRLKQALGYLPFTVAHTAGACPKSLHHGASICALIHPRILNRIP
jgi:hypothetical protein